MKTIKTLLGLTLGCLSLFACRPSTGVVVSLTDRVSVRLPAPPKREITSKPEKFVHVNDSIGDYMIVVSRLPPDYKASQREELLDYLVRVAVNCEEEHLQAPTPFDLEGYKGVELAGLVSPTSGGGKRYTANRLLIVDDTCYMFQFSSLASSSKGKAAGKAFLESITLQSTAN
jgi:hypothetical protein